MSCVRQVEGVGVEEPRAPAPSCRSDPARLAVADLDQKRAVDGHRHGLAGSPPFVRNGCGSSLTVERSSPSAGSGLVLFSMMRSTSVPKPATTPCRPRLPWRSRRGPAAGSRRSRTRRSPDRAAGGGGVAAALEGHRGEGGLGRIAVVLVRGHGDHVVGTEFGDDEGAGADRAEVGLGAFGRAGAEAVGELAAWMIGLSAADEGTVGFGVGPSKLTTTVRSSGASTLATPSNLALTCAQPPSGWVQYS
jgi:hypothetical protein